jgi:hypothetical protein
MLSCKEEKAAIRRGKKGTQMCEECAKERSIKEGIARLKEV